MTFGNNSSYTKNPASGKFSGRSRFVIAFIVIVSLILASRCYQLELRPLHSDESVNHYFVSQVMQTGVYQYSHENYHGPLYFYLLAASRVVLGDSISSLRITSVVLSIVSLGSIWLYSRLFSQSFTILAALFFGASSSLFYHSRYAIHEQLFVCVSLYLGYYLLSWTLYLRRRDLIFSAILLALLISVKETFIISVFCICCGLLAAHGSGLFRKVLTTLRQQYLTFLAACMLLLAIVSAIYTAGFRWMKGISELSLTIPQWIARSQSDTGHHKRALYYLIDVVSQAEVGLLIGFVLATVFLAFALFSRQGQTYYKRKSVNSVGMRFLFVWAASTLIVYSSIPYKTPWLVINFSAPALLFIALAASESFDFGVRTKRLSRIVVPASLLLMSYSTLFYNSNLLPDSDPFGMSNPFAYVQTDSEALMLVENIISELEERPEARVLISGEGYWPLPFYLQKYRSRLMYLKADTPQRFAENYQVIVSCSKTPVDIRGWSKSFYRINSARRVALMVKTNTG